MTVYHEPLYYEIAFGFVDAEEQADLFEEFIGKYSRVKVRRVLDIACGPGLQLRTLVKRGYKAVGLDISPQMLDHLKRKAREAGGEIETIRADMTAFELGKKVDFAFIMMGSFRFRSNEGLLEHLDCVAGSLRKGGLYLIENMELDWPSCEPQNWVRMRDGIEVRTTYRLKRRDPIRQTSEESIILEVNDHGRKTRLVHKGIVKHVFPQEFLALVALNDRFEYLGRFERFRFVKLGKASPDNIVLLRKK